MLPPPQNSFNAPALLCAAVPLFGELDRADRRDAGALDVRLGGELADARAEVGEDKTLVVVARMIIIEPQCAEERPRAARRTLAECFAVRARRGRDAVLVLDRARVPREPVPRRFQCGVDRAPPLELAD